MNERYVEDFIRGYAVTAVWLSLDDEGDPLDASGYSIDDLSAQAEGSMRNDCVDFIDANTEDLEGIYAESAGGDFWLTRNGHGAGFWDRGLGDVGDRLTKAAHAYGESTLYVTDDNELEVS